MTETDWLEIGTIVGPQGINGELRVYPNTDFPERLVEPGRRWLRAPNAREPQVIELLRGRYLPNKGLYVVQIDGIGDRTQAEALRQGRLLVPASDRPVLDPGEFHVMDLLGLAVFDQASQQQLGVVVDVIPAGNDLLEVRLHRNGTDDAGLEGAVGSEAESSQPIDSAKTEPTRSKFIRKKGRRQRKPPKKDSTVLIPFVEAIVPVVNLAEGRIEVLPPPGLIEG